MARRQSIYPSGMIPGTPTATAARVGPLLVSSIIRGTASNGSGIPERIEDEAVNLMHNIERVMKEAGGSTDDIVKISIYVRDRSVRSALDPAWEAMFPDRDNRPARHVGIGDLAMGNTNFEAEITAYIED